MIKRRLDKKLFYRTSPLLQGILFYHKYQIGPSVLVLWLSGRACIGNGRIMLGPHTGQYTNDSAALDFIPD